MRARTERSRSSSSTPTRSCASATVARPRGLDAQLVPGILPITRFPQMLRFAKRCGASVPEWLQHRFDGLDDDPDTRRLIAANVAIEQVHRLQEHGVQEFHFYTLNRAELTYAICHALGVRPAARPCRHWSLSHAASRTYPRVPPPARRAHPGAGRRHGHRDPVVQARRGGLPRRAVPRLVARPEGQQRPAGAHAAGGDRRDSPALPRSRRGHRRDQHVQFERDLAGRLRHRVAGARAEPDGGADRAPRRGRRRREDRAAALRCRRARPHEPHGLAVAGRQRPGLSRHHVRRPGRHLQRGHPRAASKAAWT